VDVNLIVGDLVKLKGITGIKNKDIPIGIITQVIKKDLVKIQWSNEDISSMWALNTRIDPNRVERI